MFSGFPSGIDNNTGLFSTTKATVGPKTIQGYSLVTDVSKLTAAQRSQLETTNFALGNFASTENFWNDKVIFATGTEEVPFPGFADVNYDTNGNIMTDGTGLPGNGQTESQLNLY